MGCIPQASFKNSRNYPRAATLTSVTNAVAIPAGGSIVIAANVNRTYLTIRNGSLAAPPGDELYYSYPGSLAGFMILPREAVDIESPESVTVSNPGINPITLYVDEGNG